MIKDRKDIVGLLYETKELSGRNLYLSNRFICMERLRANASKKGIYFKIR